MPPCSGHSCPCCIGLRVEPKLFSGKCCFITLKDWDRVLGHVSAYACLYDTSMGHCTWYVMSSLSLSEEEQFQGNYLMVYVPIRCVFLLRPLFSLLTHSRPIVRTCHELPLTFCSRVLTFFLFFCFYFCLWSRKLRKVEESPVL
jgi:hypothetical protein